MQGRPAGPAAGPRRRRNLPDSRALPCHTGPAGRRSPAAKAAGRVGGVSNIINLIGHIFSIKSIHLGLKLKLFLWQV